MLFLKLFKESFIFAIHAIIVNKLRTMLSLLGITIGIFAVISVFTFVDSMEMKIRGTIATLGDNVLFIEKWPWEFGSDFPWWKYVKRPSTQLNELDDVEKRSQLTESAAYIIKFPRTIEYAGNSLENITIMAVSNNFNNVQSFEIAEGRYFAESEFNNGRNVAMIGSDIANNLIGNVPPIGKFIKIFDRSIEVMGVFKREGEDSFGSSYDNVVVLPVNFAKNFIDLKNDHMEPIIMVKAKARVTNEELRDELTGIMRSVRKLKPSVEDDFSINETSLLTKGFEGLFAIIKMAGWFIGGFSILVGGFGIANIMFVSVKERTNQIGIQKSLGAKNYFILLQFLFEAVILSVIGGAVGLLLIFFGTLIISNLADMELTLSIKNIGMGLGVSAIIGLLSGIIPAFSASRLNPVDAIRSN